MTTFDNLLIQTHPGPRVLGTPKRNSPFSVGSLNSCHTNLDFIILLIVRFLTNRNFEPPQKCGGSTSVIFGKSLSHWKQNFIDFKASFVEILRQVFLMETFIKEDTINNRSQRTVLRRKVNLRQVCSRNLFPNPVIRYFGDFLMMFSFFWKFRLWDGNSPPIRAILPKGR